MTKASKTVQEATETVKDQAESIGKDAKEAAKNLAETAKAEAQARVDAARDRAAAEVNDVAGALRRAAGDSRDGSLQSRAFGDIADRLDEASDSLAQTSLDDVIRAASDFARRNPATFLAGAALAGFAMGRFARASGPAEFGSSQPMQDYRPVQGATAEGESVSVRTY